MSEEETTCQMCMTLQKMGESLVGSVLGSLEFDCKIVATNQNNSEMTITIPRLTPIEQMVKNFEIVLAHFHYGDYELDFKLKPVVDCQDAPGCVDSE